MTPAAPEEPRPRPSSPARRLPRAPATLTARVRRPARATALLAAGARLLAGAAACLPTTACNDMLGLTAPTLEEAESDPGASGAGAWRSDMPSLSAGRALHAAALLPNGDVALFGGCDTPKGSPVDILARLGPAQWERRPVESDAPCLFGQAAALDARGRAVAAGGFRQGAPAPSTAAMEYNLSEDALTPGDLAPAAGYWTATPLGDGRVLFAGGSSELLSTFGSSLATVRSSFDASGADAPFLGGADVVCAAGDTACMQPRTFHTATLLGDGTVLLAGGRDGDAILPSAVRYLPSERRFEPAGDMPSPRWLHAAARLSDGRVLLCGGNDTAGATATAQLFDPDAAPPFLEVSPMRIARSGHTATLLGDGRVLVAGGSDDRRAELYDPARDTWTFTPEMAQPRHLHTATLAGTGEVLVAGGQESAAPIPFDARATVERYVP